MLKPASIRLMCAGLLIFLATVVCSSGYITPASLTATANAPAGDPREQVPTAFFIFPSDTPTAAPTTPPTIDPLLTPLTPAFITPTASATEIPTQETFDANAPPVAYTAQAGDTLQSVATRFNVSPDEIVSPVSLKTTGLLNPGQLLMVPQRIGATTPTELILPDSEVVYSPSTLDFNVIAWVNALPGKLAGYRQYLGETGWTSGAQVVQRVALENSINPRLLLSLLEYQSGWVFGEPASLSESDYPMGHVESSAKGLYAQMVWAVNQLSVGYYEWRAGRLTELHFPDGSTARIAPNLNAGSAAIQYFFSLFYSGEQWRQAIDAQGGLAAMHASLFGDPWQRAALVGPLFPPDLEQPPLILPFLIGQRWAYTGGPHGAWQHEGAQAALDFAPGSFYRGCVESENWVVAASAGRVVRMGKGVVVLDLDGDGNEQTGWVLLYLHITDTEKLSIGKWVDRGEMLGHPSCEGGSSTGTHLHIARKYNGEWIAADGPLPFNLSGWVAHAGDAPYKGTLTKDDVTITACTCGSAATNIFRTE